MSESMSPVGRNMSWMNICREAKSITASITGTSASRAIRRNPECHFVVRLRVPSGVMAMRSSLLSLKRRVSSSTSEGPPGLRSPGTSDFAEKKSERPEKPAFFHQETCRTAYTPYGKFSEKEVYIARMRSHAYDAAWQIGHVNAHLPAHEPEDVCG